MLAKVKGNESLARDEESRAVINTDSRALAKARQAKAAMLKRIEREKELENRVSELEQKLEAILSRFE
jgi:hypothetical protein